MDKDKQLELLREGWDALDPDWLIHAGLAEYADFYDEDGNLYDED